MQLPRGLSAFAEVIIDSYFAINLQHDIVDFNRPFLAMLPRSVGRNLKTKKCHEVLNLSICKERCIAKQCWQAGRQVRLDEITGTIAGESEELRFILSAMPLRDDAGGIVGAMVVMRNVTDEAMVQIKYQNQMEASVRQMKAIEETLKTRTRRLLEVSRRLYSTQQELLRAKTELFG